MLKLKWSQDRVNKWSTDFIIHILVLSQCDWILGTAVTTGADSAMCWIGDSLNRTYTWIIYMSNRAWLYKDLRLARHDRLAQLDKHQTYKPVVVSCEFNSQWRQLYILLKLFRHLNTIFCTKMSEVSDLCYLPKPRIFDNSDHNLFTDNLRFLSVSVICHHFSASTLSKLFDKAYYLVFSRRLMIPNPTLWLYYSVVSTESFWLMTDF